MKVNEEQLSQMVWSYDNSWDPSFDMSAIDYVVFAGTPEWLGSMVRPLNVALLEHDIPIVYIGVGIFEGTQNRTFNQLSETDRKVLERAKYISVRDTKAQSLLAPVNAEFLPCPSLLASPTEKVRKHKKKVALCTHALRSKQSFSSGDKGKTFDFVNTLFQEINKHYDCTLVCHYIDEIAELRRLGFPILYSYDAKDYLEIYDQFDLIISTRVHGAGVCASLGIPSFMIKHTARTGTAEGFLSNVIDPQTALIDAVMEDIHAFDIKERSEKLIEHKLKTKKTYVERLKGCLIS